MTDQKIVSLLENPHIAEEFLDLIKDGLARRNLLLLVGNCWIDYEGRASSNLEPGERIVIIKGDGSVLVHRPKGYEAVNWQPPGCIFQSRIKEDILQINAIRRKPAESLSMNFDRVYLLSVMKLKDWGAFSLHASEEDMQKAILLEPSLIEDGFQPISFEKKVEPGFVDVYGVDKAGKFVIIEIKRNIAGRRAVLQLSRYVEAVKGLVSREVRGILAAPEIARGTQKLLVTLGLVFQPIDPRKCAEILHKSYTVKLVDFLESS